jgi:hypothetical protein
MLWSEKLLKFKGLPRPFFYARKNDYFRGDKRFIYKKTPVPFQSKPGRPNGPVIELIIENEKEAVNNGLCSYCGLKIENNETSIRWMVEKQNFVLNSTRDWVPSDFHPLHINCMKQARIYCPFMRTLNDDQFDIQLNQDNLKIARENVKKHYTIDWENRERHI